MKEEKKKRVRKKVESKIDDKTVVKDGNFKLIEVVIIMIVMLAFGVFLGSYFVYSKYNNRRVSCSSIRKDMNELGNIYDSILNEHYGEVDKNILFESTIKGMISGTNDTYAAYFDRDDALDLDSELNGFFVGLGIEISGLDDGLHVVSVNGGQPADRAGIKVDDVIIKMDDVSYTGLTLKDFVYEIKTSSRGETKNITILRDGKEISFDIKLDDIELYSVSSYIYENTNVGVFTINNFANNTYTQFINQYKTLVESGIKSIVIDLRGNSGGYISAASSLSSLFLDKGAVIYQKTDGDKTEKITNEIDGVIDLPVVLVVDNGTASSAEVFASSLVDNLHSKVVGINTYGKGTIQKLHTLSTGGYVKFTIQEWLTANGNKINEVGIVPDVFVAEYDLQIKTAVDLLKDN